MLPPWLTYLIEHGAPLWLIAFAFISWVFNLNKVTLYKDLIQPALGKWFDTRNEALRAHLVNTLNDKSTSSVIYGHYMTIARQLVTISWHLSKDLKEGRLTEERVKEALRVSLADVMGKVKESLGDYTHLTSKKRLDIHLLNMSNSDKVEFYAPVIAEINDVSSRSEGHDYETLRTVVLGQVDTQIANATTMVILKATNEYRRGKKSAKAHVIPKGK